MQTKKYILLFIIILVSIFSFSSVVINVFAKEGGDVQGAASIPNPLGDKNTDPNQLIGLIINGILGITGSIALVMFIYGGLVWMTAMGKSESVQKGKDIILWAVIGLVVIFSAYAMVNFVLNDVIGAASS